MSDCVLCHVIATETSLDSILSGPYSWETGYRIYKTKNMKGHSKRCMVVSLTHTENGDYNKALGFLFQFIQKNHRNHDWAIMEPTHASIPEHYHLVATTINENAEDLDLIADTDRIEILFRRRVSGAFQQ